MRLCCYRNQHCFAEAVHLIVFSDSCRRCQAHAKRSGYCGRCDPAVHPGSKLLVDGWQKPEEIEAGFETPTQCAPALSRGMQQTPAPPPPVEMFLILAAMETTAET